MNTQFHLVLRLTIGRAETLLPPECLQVAGSENCTLIFTPTYLRYKRIRSRLKITDIYHDRSLQKKFSFIFNGKSAYIFKALTSALEFSELCSRFAAQNGLRVQSVDSHISVRSTA